MPYASAHDGIRLHYEEAGSGTPILFVHEFAGDHRSWEPQMRYFSRRHRCIAYAARGYAPSDVPPAGAYTYEHFRDDVPAMLDHLGIDRAHLVGLSMGGYTVLHAGLMHPERALSLTLAGTGSGSPPEELAEFRQSAEATARRFETEGSGEIARTYGVGPTRVPFMVKDSRGFAEFCDALASHHAQGSAHVSRGFQGGRPSLYDFEDEIRALALPTLIIVGDEDDPCVAPGLFLKRTIAASGLAVFPKSGHTVNIEEPALFNQTVDSFLTLAEAGRWGPRDPRSIRPATGAHA